MLNCTTDLLYSEKPSNVPTCASTSMSLVSCSHQPTLGGCVQGASRGRHNRRRHAAQPQHGPQLHLCYHLGSSHRRHDTRSSDPRVISYHHPSPIYRTRGPPPAAAFVNAALSPDMHRPATAVHRRRPAPRAPSLSSPQRLLLSSTHGRRRRVDLC